MEQEKYIEHYRGHQVLLYGTPDKLWWKIILPEEELNSQDLSSSFVTPKTFLSRDSAVADAKKFIDKFIPSK